MKKIGVVAALLFSGICINAQEDSPPDFPRNEFKGNALLLILGSFELTYERLINDESGLGVSLNIPYIYDDWNLNFSVSPYYRYYFGNKPAAGFFAEGFAMLNNFRDYYSTYVGDWNSGTGYWNYTRKTRTDFALGIGIGGKWVSKKGVLLEINTGVGRNIFGGSYDGEFELVGRGGITVGYRF